MSLTEGTKYDGGKIRWDLLPFSALEEIAKVYTFGANKYEDWNWHKGIKYSRCVAAMWRHFKAWWWDLETLDPESKCHHLASVGFYVLVLLEFDASGKYAQFDDRLVEVEKK